MNIYLDASVLVPMQVQEEKTEAVRRLTTKADGAISVSTLAAGEFTSAISWHVRMKILTEEDANRRLGFFDIWLTSTSTIALDNADIRRASSIVRCFDLKLMMPDAIHVALCERHVLALATLDERLAEAARGLGVEVVVPE